MSEEANNPVREALLKSINSALQQKLQPIEVAIQDLATTQATVQMELPKLETQVIQHTLYHKISAAAIALVGGLTLFGLLKNRNKP